jgi:hypothetical protein
MNNRTFPGSGEVGYGGFESGDSGFSVLGASRIL